MTPSYQSMCQESSIYRVLVKKQALFLVVALTLCAGTKDLCAQWIQSNGPYGGAISCFAQDSSAFYACTYDAGVFRSTNNGNNWQFLGRPVTKPRVGSMVVVGDTMFIGTYESGVHASTDWGETWKSMSVGLEEQTIVELTICDSSLLCSGRYGVYHSTDWGRTWTKIFSQSGRIIVSGSDLFVISPAGIKSRTDVSTDCGISWRQTSGVIDNATVYSLASIDSHLFAAADNEMFHSTDRGESWQEVNIASRAISIVSIDDRLFAAGDESGVVYSDDLGKTWKNTAYEEFASRLAVHGSNLFHGFRGVNRSTDMGASWAPVNHGLLGDGLYSLTTRNGKILTGSTWEVFASTDNGESWEVAGTDSPPAVVGFAQNDSYLFAGSIQSTGVIRSSDNGASWSPTGLTYSGVFAVATKGSLVFAATNLGGVARSSDNGSTWTYVNNGMPRKTATAIAASSENVYVGLENQPIYVSTDDGITWNDRGGGILHKQTNCLVTLNDDVFAATPSGVFRSEDGTTSWADITNSSSASHALCFATVGSNLFAGFMDGGVQLTRDRGESWEEINTGLPEGLTVYAIAANETDLFAGTVLGVWKRPLADLGISSIAVSQPDDTHVFVYPNPVDNVLTVTSSESRLRKLSVCNLTGEVILSAIVPDVLQYKLDVTPLPVGAYMLRVVFDTNTTTLVVIKE